MSIIWKKIRDWMAERIVDVFFILWHWPPFKKSVAVGRSTAGSPQDPLKLH
jgi:hypothetical protein